MAQGNGARGRRGGQTIMIITCCAAVVLMQMWLTGTIGVHPLVAGAITLGVVGVFVLVGWVANRMGARARRELDVREVDPLLAEYAETHAKKQLIRTYEEWSGEPHAVEARVRFLKGMMLALADDGHNFEARARVPELEALATTDELRRETDAFLAELEGHIAASQARKDAEGQEQEQ